MAWIWTVSDVNQAAVSGMWLYTDTNYPNFALRAIFSHTDGQIPRVFEIRHLRIENWLDPYHILIAEIAFNTIYRMVFGH